MKKKNVDRIMSNEEVRLEVASMERQEVEIKIIAKLCLVNDLKYLKIVEDVIDTALKAEEYKRKKPQTDVDGCLASWEGGAPDLADLDMEG